MLDELPLVLQIALGIVTGGGILFGAVRLAINRYISEIDRKHQRFEAKFKEVDERFNGIEPRLQSHFERMDGRLMQMRNDMDEAEQDFGKNITKLHERITTLLTDWPDKFVSQREFDAAMGRIAGQLDELIRRSN